MIKKDLKKLVGYKKSEFDDFIRNNQVQVQPARLIPIYKTGDEMALTSIFLSSLKLVKEYRDLVFKELKLSRFGRHYYYTEVVLDKDDKCRFDGLIIQVSKGVIKDAVVFEMKNKGNEISEEQLERYLKVAKRLKIPKVVSVSNEFVSDSTKSPVNVRCPKGIDLRHFSWTYLLTMAELLLFKNDTNIEDDDQVEIMKEVLHYMQNPTSGVMGYTQMKKGWKLLADSVRSDKPIRTSDSDLVESLLSWDQEVKDMSLLMSRRLGVLVRPSKKHAVEPKDALKRFIKTQIFSSYLEVPNSVSDVKLVADFNRRAISFSVKVQAPQDKGQRGRLSWFSKQLEQCQKRAPEQFENYQQKVWIEADVKYAKENEVVRITELENLFELTEKREIASFHVKLVDSMGASFSSLKKFVSNSEKTLLDFYEIYVQHLKNWSRPAPKVVKPENVVKKVDDEVYSSPFTYGVITDEVRLLN